MNILILEDESCVVNVLRIVLQRRGYSISETTTAQDALESCGKNGHLDLLIADVNLPTSSGIEVALQLKERIPNLKIILISGYPPGCFNDQHAALFSELPSDSVQF